MLSEALSEGLGNYRIGSKIRTLRTEKSLGLAQLGDHTGLSAGMLSKIENGQTSPSLATLTSLANALQVPVTSFFRGYEEQRDVTYIKARCCKACRWCARAIDTDAPPRIRDARSAIPHQP